MEHTQQPQIDSKPADTAEAMTGTFTKRIELPSGGWAELLDPMTIRTKHRRRVLETLNIERMTRGAASVGLDMSDGLILMMVEKWSVDYLPGVGRPLDNPESLEELELPDYDVLTDAMETVRKIIFPAPANIDGARTPGSPTLPGSV